MKIHIFTLWCGTASGSGNGFISPLSVCYFWAPSLSFCRFFSFFSQDSVLEIQEQENQGIIYPSLPDLPLTLLPSPWAQRQQANTQNYPWASADFLDYWYYFLIIFFVMGCCIKSSSLFTLSPLNHFILLKLPVLINHPSSSHGGNHIFIGNHIFLGLSSLSAPSHQAGLQDRNLLGFDLSGSSRPDRAKKKNPAWVSLLVWQRANRVLGFLH